MLRQSRRRESQAKQRKVFHRLLQLGKQGDPPIDTEEVVGLEDAGNVANAG